MARDRLRNLVELLEQGPLRVLISSERPLADAANALAESQAATIDSKLVLTCDVIVSPQRTICSAATPLLQL
jgi:NADPH:quinone reductase-like Zn-dependent oxidoreductase